jgi:transcriptional regulator with XRE-family HTH domain
VNENSIKLPFAERLRITREKMGLSQQDLVRLCGFGFTQISRYERGLQEPSLVGVTKLAQVLNVSVDYLVGLTDDPQGRVRKPDLNDYEDELVETFRREGWGGVIRLGAARLEK